MNCIFVKNENSNIKPNTNNVLQKNLMWYTLPPMDNICKFFVLQLYVIEGKKLSEHYIKVEILKI